jgi:transcription antitermination factor NusG
MNWYALHVRSSQEHLVALKLERAGIESFYPHTVSKSKDTLRTIETRYMPGYVFASFDLEKKTPVVAISQVVSILGWGRHAVPVPLSEIEAVRTVCAFPTIVMPWEFITAGQKVRVRYGPLQGLEGILVSHKNATRVVVSVTMLGRSIAAQVDAEAIEAIEPAALAA